MLLAAPVWMQLVHLLLADLSWIALIILGIEALAEPAKQAAADRYLYPEDLKDSVTAGD